MSARIFRPRSLRPWWRRFKRNGYRPDRCAHCGHGFRWTRDARHANGNRDGKIFHGPCMSYLIWRGKGEERLGVLGLVLEISAVTQRDIETVSEFRDDGLHVFSVFHDLQREAALAIPTATGDE